MADTEFDEARGATIGERLRAAREEKGLKLDEVARQTRIPLRHLEHIERGEWEALPAVTYSVGFARSYANAVGLDGAEIGAELRQELGAVRSNSGPAAAYYEPADPARVPPRSIALIAGVIALLLVGLYLYWRSGAVGDAPEPQVAETQPAQSTAPLQQAPPPAAPASGPVVLTATDDVWLRVSEANGPKLYEGTLKRGERYEVPAGAQAPEIMTGRPNALNVSVGATAIPPLGPPERRISGVSLRPADLAARVGQAAVPPAPSGAPAAR